jgi:CRP-like cAMP-binding protein
MNISDLDSSKHPFLNGMSKFHLQTLAKAATQAHFAAGARIFQEGEPASRLYLIQAGTVSLQTRSAGHPVRISTIDAGEALGWSWLFPPYFWRFDAWAEEPVDSIVFDAAQLRRDCELDNTLGYELTKRAVEIVVLRLHATRLKLVQNVKHDVEAAQSAHHSLGAAFRN